MTFLTVQTLAALANYTVFILICYVYEGLHVATDQDALSSSSTLHDGLASICCTCTGAHASATGQLPSQDAGATAASTGRWVGSEECQIDPSLMAALNSGQRGKGKESFNLEFSHPAVVQKLQQRLP